MKQNGNKIWSLSSEVLSDKAKLMQEKTNRLARTIFEQYMKEQELMVAYFLITNPDVPADRIVLVTNNLSDGNKAFTVREMTDEEADQGYCVQ